MTGDLDVFDSAPSVACGRCRRRTWTEFGLEDRMPQPDGFPCGGRFPVPANITVPQRTTTGDLFGQDFPQTKLFIPGTPVPEGSVHSRAVGRGSGPDRVYTGKTVTVHDNNTALSAWRDTVAAGCLDPRGGPVVHYPRHHPVTCTLEFVMPRLKNLPKRAPTPHHTKKPDLDKLERAVFDALTAARVWVDDAQAVAGYRSKRYAELGEHPGVHISLTTPLPVPQDIP